MAQHDPLLCCIGNWSQGILGQGESPTRKLLLPILACDSHVWRRWKNDEMEKHSSAWSTIMKDDRWLVKMEELGLHPFLVGSDVIPVYHGKKGSHYLVLGWDRRRTRLRLIAIYLQAVEFG
jgi:hypothetical protein